MNMLTRILRSKKPSSIRRGSKLRLSIEALEARDVPAGGGLSGTMPPPQTPSNVIQYDAVSKTLTVYGTDARDKVEVKTVYGPSPDINTPGPAVGTIVTLGQLSTTNSYTESASWGGFMSPEVSRIRFYGKDGDDLFSNLTSISNSLFGGNGNDELNAGGGNNYISGQAGNDSLNGGNGNDTLVGSFGNDELDAGGGNDKADGGAGHDTIEGGGGNDTLKGGAGSDDIEGDAGNDRIEAGDGDDEADGGAGNDKIWGGAGIDKLSGSDGNDQLYAGSGKDTVFGGNGNDFLDGEDGKDQLHGGAGNDSLLGGDGNDFLGGGDGNDTLDGGIGDDILHAGAGHDTIYGRQGNDQILAGAGNDWVSGAEGNDHILGEDGNDTIHGSSGNDTLYGGDGHDSINGWAGNDVIQGDDGNDTLKGGDGHDTIHGNDGNDKLYGEAGADRLYGDLGSDSLFGGLGLDTLVSIDGTADTLFGGVPANTFGTRDNYWMDSADWTLNKPALDDLHVPSRSMHHVQSFESYWVGAQPVSVGLQPNVGDLVDPLPEGDDEVTEGYFSNQPLFGTNGPDWSDVDQGSTGTCYFMARLAALAKTYPQHIKDMVVELGDGTYAVQFHKEGGGKAFVRVDSNLWKNADGNPMYADLGNQGSMWVAIVEKAWAIYRNGNASYEQISGGGGSGNIDRDVALGLKTVSMKDVAPNGLEYVKLIKAALAAGKGVNLGGPAKMTNNTAMVPENKDRAAHIYMVHSVQTNAQGIPVKLKLYNLYGGGLTEITNFDMLYYCAGGAVALSPK